MELDKYTKDMLFKNILNEYSDAEILDIIEYLVKYLKDLNNINLDKNSIEKIYYKGLENVLNDILDLKVREHDFLLEN